MAEDVVSRIEEQVKNNRVMVFMKGTPNFPQCGFSGDPARPRCGVREL